MHREVEFELFEDDFIQIDLVIFVDRKIQIAFGQLGLAGLAGFVLARRKEKINGSFNFKADRFEAAVTRQFQFRPNLPAQPDVNSDSVNPARRERGPGEEEFMTTQIKLTVFILMLKPEAVFG